MWDIIKFELYKMFSKKSFKALLLVIVLFSSFYVFIHDVIDRTVKGIGSVDNAYSVLKEYEGEVITEEGLIRIDETLDKLMKKEANNEKLTKEETIYLSYLNDARVNINPAYLINGEVYLNVDEVKSKIDSLEQEGKTDTYEYKNITFIYSKIKNVEEAKYHFKGGWYIPTDFVVKATFISILMIVGIAPIFSDEHQSNSAQIILSCKRGKSKLVLAKIIAGLIFTTLMFILINGMYIISAINYKFIGWDAPLELFKYYRATPFDIRIIDFYLIGLGISYIGFILFALFIMLSSLLVKNNMISLFVGLAIFYGPNIISGIMPIEQISRIFKELNIAQVMKVENLIRVPNTYNILGNPVLGSTILIISTIVFIPIIFYLIKHFGKKQVV